MFSSPIIIFTKVDINSKPHFIVESFKSPMPATIKLQNIMKLRVIYCYTINIII